MVKSLTELFNDKQKGINVPSTEFDLAKLEQIDKDYAMREGGAESIGRTALSSAKKDDDHPDNAKKKDQAFSDLLTRLMDQQRWLKQQIKIIKQEIERLTKIIDEHADNLNALDDFLEHYRQHGEFDLSTCGYPKDDVIRQLIINQEKETGMMWDANSPNTFGFIRDIEQNERAQITKLSHQIDEKYKQWDTYQKAYENTNDSIEKLERGEYVSDIELMNYIEQIQSSDALDTTPKDEILDFSSLPSLGM